MSKSKSRKFQSLKKFLENTFLGVFIAEKHDFDGFRGTFPRKNLSFRLFQVRIINYGRFNSYFFTFLFEKSTFYGSHIQMEA